jgi:DNA-binding response OmpR family regulator
MSSYERVVRAVMSPETVHFYEFGNFRLDPSAKILFCENKPVSLTPKVFETLQVFVEDF